MTTVVFPWPLKDLSPNARVHYMTLHRAKKQYRTACWIAARKAGMSAATLMGSDEAAVHLTFYPPDRRIRDQDNLIASMKSGLDGLADALKVDDSNFRVTFDISDDIGGMVKVSVTPLREAA